MTFFSLSSNEAVTHYIYSVSQKKRANFETV